MKKLPVRRSLSVVGFLVGFLLIGFSDAQAFYEKDLRTSLEVFEGRKSSPLGSYYQWGKDNLPTWCMPTYMGSLNRAQYVMTFVTWIYQHNMSVVEAQQSADCAFDVIDISIQHLRNQDSAMTQEEKEAAREALIKKYAARYEECRNIAKEQKLKFDGKTRR